MKKLALILSLILIVSLTKAQDNYQNDEIQTIFSKNRSNGGYGAFTISYSEIGGRDALVTGGRGAFIFDHSLAIGLGGFGFVNNLDYNSHSNLNEYSLAGGYGGIFFEPIIAGKSPVHVSFPILIGMGGVSLFQNYGWDYWEQHNPYPSIGNDVFFVIEPAVELEFNLARFFRLAANVSYRHTSEIELFETKGDALRGFNFGMTFKFGKF
jgi:hypothetical protein